MFFQKKKSLLSIGSFIKVLGFCFLSLGILATTSVHAADENCSNGVDDDGDFDIDCDDIDCTEDPACETTPPELNCSDGIDNNGDGNTDCADTTCSAATACQEDCTDGIDNDLNGDIDCADSACSENPACKEIDCADGIDSDNDGATDCADSDCAETAACNDTTDPSNQAENDQDQDQDGFTPNQGDCDDTNDQINPEAIEICDEVDNNCNSFADEGCVGDLNVDDDGDSFTENDGDCDDSNPDVNPDAKEVCASDSLDSNCDGFDFVEDTDFTDCVPVAEVNRATGGEDSGCRLGAHSIKPGIGFLWLLGIGLLTLVGFFKIRQRLE